MKIYKLFASYLQEKQSKSIESVSAEQQQGSDIAKTKQKHSKPSSKNCIF